MGDRESTIRYLTETKRDLTAKRDRLLRPVQEIEKELEHVSATLAILLRNAASPVPETQSDFPLTKLRGLSHAQAVVVIARQSGGVLKAQDAKRIMIAAGIMRETKNSTNMTHNAIIQSGKFDRIGRGEFRLKDSNPNAPERRPLLAAIQ